MTADVKRAWWNEVVHQTAAAVESVPRPVREASLRHIPTRDAPTRKAS